MALRYVTTRNSVAAVLGACLVLGACGDSESGDSASSGSSIAADGTGSDTASTGSSDCADYTAYGDLEGTSVSVYSPVVDPEDKTHVASYEMFEECTGATIEYEGSLELPVQLPVRVEAGTPPDIAFIPQPGLLSTLVATGEVKPAPPAVSDNVDAFFGADWRAYGTIDGTLYAAPLDASVKSFVWYSPATFEDAGYVVPETYDELLELTETIATDHPEATPWCAGFSFGDATGWVGTDWLEDLMLRTADPDVYDQWVTHEIPFNDPQVATALAKVGEILKDPRYVNGSFGDPTSIATTTVQDAGLGILDDTCYLHRQASFYGAFWPEGTTVTEDGDVWAFYLPPIDAARGKPILGGGQFVAAFTDRPEVQAFQAYLASDTWANDKAKVTPRGGWVSANTGLEVENLASPIDQLSAQILQDPEAVFRFDGSDLMPSAVGSGTFWTGMTDWIIGQSDEETLDYIERSWPG